MWLTHSRHVFFTVVNAGKDKIKGTQPNVLSGEGLSSGSEIVPFHSLVIRREDR